MILFIYLLFCLFVDLFIFHLNFTFSGKCENVCKWNTNSVRRAIRVLNLHREKTGRDGKIIKDHRQDGNVDLWGSSAISSGKPPQTR